MSVAGCLGLQEVEGALMTEARAAWRDWVDQRLVDGVVDDLASLPEWTLSSPTGANHVLGVLASLTESEPEAVTALAWVLLPGAEAVARKLADLHGDIDGMVAGQLWIEVAAAHRIRSGKVAAAILGKTRREVCAELGVGDLARRRDLVWTDRIGTDVPELIAERPPSRIPSTTRWSCCGTRGSTMRSSPSTCGCCGTSRPLRIDWARPDTGGGWA